MIRMQGSWLIGAALMLVLGALSGGPALAQANCPPGSSAPECAAPAPVTDLALTASFHAAPACATPRRGA